MNNLTYRGAKSRTYNLVLFLLLLSTLMLVLGKITGGEWIASGVAAVLLWVGHDVSAKGFEAYRDKGTQPP